MPRDGAIILGDLIGKLRILRLDCPKCGKWGQYLVDRLVIRYGSDTKLQDWMEGLLVDCPRMQSHKSGAALPLLFGQFCGLPAPNLSDNVMVQQMAIESDSSWFPFGLDVLRHKRGREH